MRNNPAFWINVLGNGGEPIKWNEATGGTTAEVTIGSNLYRIHTFTSSGTFAVTRALFPFTIAGVGGGFHGGIGNSSQYGGGGGATHLQNNIIMPTGGITVTVAGQGGTSTVGSYFTAEGAKGGNGVPGSPGGGSGAPNGGTGANGAQWDIGNGVEWYGGGGSSVNWNYCCDPCCFGGNRNQSGGGAGHDCGGRNAYTYGGGGGRNQHTCPGPGSGFQGLIKIRYQIDGDL